MKNPPTHRLFASLADFEQQKKEAEKSSEPKSQLLKYATLSDYSEKSPPKPYTIIGRGAETSTTEPTVKTEPPAKKPEKMFPGVGRRLGGKPAPRKPVQSYFFNGK